MRIQLDATELNFGMSMVSRALSVRPIRQVYDGVLLETMEDGLLLTCTDGEMTIKTLIPAQIEEDGCALLPAKLFGDLARKLPSGQVTLQVKDGARCLITGVGSRTSMACMDAEDFPDVAQVQGGFATVLPQNKLRDAISKITFAISNDETRKILTGCLMETAHEETRLVGLDGFRLALQRIYASHSLPEGTDAMEAVIPGRVIAELGRMLPDTEDEVQIVCSGVYMMASFQNTRVFSTLLTGEYINYRQIMPVSWQTEIRVRRAPFAEAVERAALMAREGKNNLLRMHLAPEEMKITSVAERGEADETLSIDFSGNEMAISFNSRYLADVLRNIEDDELAMRFNTNVSPCLVCPVEGNQYTYLVLPVRTFG